MMFYSKSFIALSLMLLCAPPLFTEAPRSSSMDACCKQIPQGPQGAPGAAGEDAPIAFAWGQTAFSQDNAPLVVATGDKIPFDDPSIVLQGVSYANGDFTLNAGIYRATFQGYILRSTTSTMMGVQFFLNDVAIGTEYKPIIASDEDFIPPYQVITQAIFEVSADGSIFSVKAIGDPSDAFDLGYFIGSAAASVKIVKIADSATP